MVPMIILFFSKFKLACKYIILYLTKDWWIILIFTAIGFQIGAYGNNSVLVTFLERWQTLVAGLAALVAALMTIHKMEETDSRAALRAEDQVAVQLHRDRQYLWRASEFLELLTFNAQIVFDDNIKSIESAMQSFSESSQLGVGDVDLLNATILRNSLTKIFQSADKIGRSLDHQEYKRAEPLVSPKARQTGAIILYSMISLKKGCDRLFPHDDSADNISTILKIIDSKTKNNWINDLKNDLKIFDSQKEDFLSDIKGILGAYPALRHLKSSHYKDRHDHDDE